MKNVNDGIDIICQKIDKIDRLEDLVKTKGISLEKPEPKEIPPNLSLHNQGY